MKSSSCSLSLLALALGVAFAGNASAATVTKTLTQNAATSCTLAVPTTNTGVRPRATGYRNEGTVNNFVICGFDIDSVDPGFNSLTLRFQSFDGADHTFNCTGMSRFVQSSTGEYATKPVTTTANGATVDLGFSDADFPGQGLYPWGQSITCLLPPGAAILGVQSSHDDADGE